MRDFSKLRASSTEVHEAEFVDEEQDDGEGEEEIEDETVRLGDIEDVKIERIHSGIDPLDHVLGDGAVLGTAILIGGEPGVGKSTLLTEAIAAFTTKNIKTLYGCGEESPLQLKWRIARLRLIEKNKALSRNLMAHHGTRLEALLDAISEIEPKCIVIDSIQMYESEESTGRAGSINQIKYAAKQLVSLNASLGSVLFLVCHVTKDNSFAGPKSLEHLVDCNLMLEHVIIGDSGTKSGTVQISASKNRYGSTLERGFFRMTESGIIAGNDPEVDFEHLHSKPKVTTRSRRLKA